MHTIIGLAEWVHMKIILHGGTKNGKEESSKEESNEEKGQEEKIGLWIVQKQIEGRQ